MGSQPQVAASPYAAPPPGAQNPYGPPAAPNPYAPAPLPNAYGAQPYNQAQNQAQNQGYNQVSHAANVATGWAVGAASAIGNAFDQAVAPSPNPYAQPGYGAPQAPPPAAFGPGARVYVQWADGNRYPATVVQSAGAQCLVSFPDGQQRWVEAQYLSTGT
jgi:hypothetical protein